MTRPALICAASAALAAYAPALAWAAEEAPALPEAGLGPAVFKMLGGMALVLGLMFGLYWLLKRWAPGRMTGGMGGGLRLVGRLPLGPRKFVGLVEVAGRVLVLGITEQKISLLATIDDTEKIKEISPAQGASFSKALFKASRRDGEQ